jgi:uncharacterized membrane protein required for colicin V production
VGIVSSLIRFQPFGHFCVAELLRIPFFFYAVSLWLDLNRFRLSCIIGALMSSTRSCFFHRAFGYFLGVFLGTLRFKLIVDAFAGLLGPQNKL